jgi:hypothetical protein
MCSRNLGRATRPCGQLSPGIPLRSWMRLLRCGSLAGCVESSSGVAVVHYLRGDAKSYLTMVNSIVPRFRVSPDAFVSAYGLTMGRRRPKSSKSKFVKSRVVAVVAFVRSLLTANTPDLSTSPLTSIFNASASPIGWQESASVGMRHEYELLSSSSIPASIPV